VPFLSNFNETRIFSTDVSKNPQNSNLMIICPVGAGLLRTDGSTGQTDTQALLAILPKRLESAPVGLGHVQEFVLRFLSTAKHLSPVLTKSPLQKLKI